jgi:coproporphyrinogen III oxidase-like Fe-S oxidoreductase
VSTVGDLRWRNAADVEAYMRAWSRQGSPRRLRSTSLKGDLGAVDGGPRARETERLDPVTRARERLFLAARIGARVELSELDAALERAALQPLAGAGFISLRGGTLSVTRKGRYVANEVCVRLFRDSFYGG